MESELTPLELNNVIVQCRKIVDKSKLRCTRKILTQIKLLKNKSGTKEQVEKNQRKIARLLSEVSEIKKMKHDDVTKFALVNTKSSAELMSKTPSQEKIAFYKVVFCDLLVKKIDEFREKHTKWPIEVPFILQRLGLQYKSKKNKEKTAKIDKNGLTEEILPKKKIKTKKSKKKEENDEDQAGNDTQSVENMELSKNEAEVRNHATTSKNLTEIEDFSVLKKRAKFGHATTLKKQAERKKNTKEPAGLNEKDPVVGINKNYHTNGVNKDAHKSVVNKTVEIKEGRFGQMEVRRLKLDEIFGEDIIPSVSNEPQEFDECQNYKKGKILSNILKNDPFFASDGYGANDIPAGSIKEDENVNLDMLPEDKDGRSYETNNSRKTFNSKFSSSLKNAEEKSGNLHKKDRKMDSKRGGKMHKPEVLNANLVPLGKQPTEAPSFRENRTQRRQKLRQEAEKEAELASLHPSWQAKKKQKQPMLLPAVGKKIKFTDDYSDNP